MVWRGLCGLFAHTAEPKRVHLRRNGHVGHERTHQRQLHEFAQPRQLRHCDSHGADGRGRDPGLCADRVSDGLLHGTPRRANRESRVFCGCDAAHVGQLHRQSLRLDTLVGPGWRDLWATAPTRPAAGVGGHFATPGDWRGHLGHLQPGSIFGVHLHLAALHGFAHPSRHRARACQLASGFGGLGRSPLQNIHHGAVATGFSGCGGGFDFHVFAHLG